MIIALQIVWFLLPMYFANMSPVFAVKIFKIKNPIDFGKGIFGNNKTYVGFFSGVMVSILIIFLQSILYKYPFLNSISIVDYSKINLLLFGFLIGFGAMFGDLIKSFFKRRLNIAPGRKFIPFDQIDYTLGTFLLLSLVYFPGWFFLLISLLISFIGNIIINHVGFYLRLRNTKW